MGQDEFTKLTSLVPTEDEEGNHDFEELEDGLVQFLGRCLILQEKSNNSSHFAKEVLHLGVSLLQFAFDFVFFLVVPIVVVRSAILQHDVKLDGLFHVENEGPDCAGLYLGGFTCETDKQHLE